MEVSKRQIGNLFISFDYRDRVTRSISDKAVAFNGLKGIASGELREEGKRLVDRENKPTLEPLLAPSVIGLPDGVIS
ncbi:hypothetical protein HCH_00250 [Hahella chejuensis KCTC 2396]|uniref:Uncharacterized protein n=1 Tax=Hahella chejuensis (strain KCTC 2396) TaxID=349521 RepID=Q2SQB1_HAHCH|nr:hypothetical protein [Hahella chejuensis]ABC27163.1 hypothetical protein HCH_00250 [Hahella chejuensis KCTC 2396]